MTERKRGGEKTIARMYTVSVKDEERFYLKLLLLHVPGAATFEFLRTFMVICAKRSKLQLWHEAFSNQMKSVIDV